MNSPAIHKGNAAPARWRLRVRFRGGAQRFLSWLTTTTAGITCVLIGALVIGLFANWALHPTFPPKLVLDEPQPGSWSWLLHDLFLTGREVTGLAAILVAAVAVVLAAGWWMVHLLRRR